MKRQKKKIRLYDGIKVVVLRNGARIDGLIRIPLLSNDGLLTKTESHYSRDPVGVCYLCTDDKAYDGFSIDKKYRKGYKYSFYVAYDYIRDNPEYVYVSEKRTLIDFSVWGEVLVPLPELNASIKIL